MTQKRRFRTALPPIPQAPARKTDNPHATRAFDASWRRRRGKEALFFTASMGRCSFSTDRSARPVELLKPALSVSSTAGGTFRQGQETDSVNMMDGR